MDVKLIKANKNKPARVEVRWSKGTANVLLIVGLDGYNHKYYKPEGRWSTNTLGKNIHLSMNGPLIMTFDEMGQFMNEIGQAVNEAKRKLRELT
jgi:hypothetical protein